MRPGWFSGTSGHRVNCYTLPTVVDVTLSFFPHNSRCKRMRMLLYLTWRSVSVCWNTLYSLSLPVFVCDEVTLRELIHARLLSHQATVYCVMQPGMRMRMRSKNCIFYLYFSCLFSSPPQTCNLSCLAGIWVSILVSLHIHNARVFSSFLGSGFFVHLFLKRREYKSNTFIIARVIVCSCRWRATEKTAECEWVREREGESDISHWHQTVTKRETQEADTLSWVTGCPVCDTARKLEKNSSEWDTHEQSTKNQIRLAWRVYCSAVSLDLDRDTREHLHPCVPDPSFILPFLSAVSFSFSFSFFYFASMWLRSGLLGPSCTCPSLERREKVCEWKREREQFTVGPKICISLVETRLHVTAVASTAIDVGAWV